MSLHFEVTWCILVLFATSNKLDLTLDYAEDSEHEPVQASVSLNQERVLNYFLQPSELLSTDLVPYPAPTLTLDTIPKVLELDKCKSKNLTFTYRLEKDFHSFPIRPAVALLSGRVKMLIVLVPKASLKEALTSLRAEMDHKSGPFPDTHFRLYNVIVAVLQEEPELDAFFTWYKGFEQELKDVFEGRKNASSKSVRLTAYLNKPSSDFVFGENDLLGHYWNKLNLNLVFKFADTNGSLLAALESTAKALSHPEARHLANLDIVPVQREVLAQFGGDERVFYQATEAEMKSMQLVVCFKKETHETYRRLWKDLPPTTDKREVVIRRLEMEKFFLTQEVYKFLFYLHYVVKQKLDWLSLQPEVLKQLGLGQYVAGLGQCIGNVQRLEKSDKSAFKKLLESGLPVLFANSGQTSSNRVETPVFYSRGLLVQPGSVCFSDNCSLASDLCAWAHFNNKQSDFCAANHGTFPILATFGEEKDALNLQKLQLENKVPCAPYEVPDMCGVCGGSYFAFDKCPATTVSSAKHGGFVNKIDFFIFLLVTVVFVLVLVLFYLRTYQRRMDLRFRNFMNRYRKLDNEKGSGAFANSRFGGLFARQNIGNELLSSNEASSEQERVTDAYEDFGNLNNL